MKATLAEVARALAAETFGDTNVPVAGWSVDSRTIRPGELFFALPGPRYDGHDFVAAAFAAGACGAVVSRPVAQAAGPLLRVADTGRALWEAARWARARFPGRVVAVTGSAGKTTTKEAIAALLSTAMKVGRSEGNLNNRIGVPLSLLRLPEDAQAAVLELAMNRRGEIRELAGLAQPEIGVVTNVGRAHAGFFESPEEIALAKRELIEALPAGGVAVLNADDPRVAAFAAIHPGPVLTFGFSEKADVRAEDAEWNAAGARFRVGGVTFESPLPGRHGILNVLAALAVARLFGLPLPQLREPVRKLEASPMRGRRLVHRGVTILDDCYNSNPEALQAMLETLRAEPARRRIAVLGEMLELGRWAEALHREAGRRVVECGVDVLIGVRGAARFLVEEAIRAGMRPEAAFFVEEPEEAGRLLRPLALEGDVVLFKASRGVRLERAIEEFLRPEAGGEES
ncbi:MAG: UDP-N-acetylmuramoyl-tripeptide--D-alanyl-D-alanine ligase [Bryobacterales bacterium]|nr:UDP-N-acetylmuramoyl-tripeptide--D-alanyl-D-alanine ligase [Bryobacteraceae bacterium]MDW8131164.1 UDP-N-acetylmuramoyl-tripeptide--D-alanyl-D-alanine ligase [Bryobacterales bacterium]